MMKLLDMSDYSGPARLYWWAVTSAGLIVVVNAAASARGLTGGTLIELLALMAAAFLAGLNPIHIPGVQAAIAPGDVFIFLAVLFLGPAAATLVAAMDGLGTAWRSSNRLTSRLGGPAIIAIAVFVSGSLFERSVAALGDTGLPGTAVLLISLLLMSVAYFLLNTFMLAEHHALKRSK